MVKVTIRPLCVGVLLELMVLGGCNPPTPNAGRLTQANLADIVPPGETAGGRVGDYYLKNEQATFILQKPGRELSLGPYGGTLIDAAVKGGADTLGELIPAFALGRTVQINSMQVVSDGSDDGRAVIEARGIDATNVYYNLEGVLPSLLSYVEDGSGVLGFDANATMGLTVRIRYALEPDEARLAITYTFENNTNERRPVPLGFLLDSRATGEPFMPGIGFGGSVSLSQFEDNLFALLGDGRTTSQLAFATAEGALSIVPRYLGDQRPRVIGVQIPFVGSAVLLNSRNLAAAAKGASFTLEVGESIDARLDVVVADELSEVLARGWDLLEQELGDVSGCVHTDEGAPAVGVRVGLMSSNHEPQAAFQTGEDGCFAGRVPLGSYQALAGHRYRLPSMEVSVTVPGQPSHVELTLAPLGIVEVEVDVFDRIDVAQDSLSPCRIVLIGDRTSTYHPALAAQSFDDPGGVIARQKYLRHCRGHVEVMPGRYLAIVTRGPEYDKLEMIVEVNADAPGQVTGSLHRVVDSGGYAASDFHVHSVYSSDSTVPAEERVLSLAGEALDFWASTDHDVVTDFQPHIEAWGLQNELWTIPGTEVTTFDTGHFNAYPMPYDAGRANGGTPDWAGIDGRPTFASLFASIHQHGALVQVNHPRKSGVALTNYFDRAGVRYDPTSGQPFADPAAQTVANAFLRFPDDVTLFSADFDVIEVMNGASTYVREDMVYEVGVERDGHDWMNFLSAGFRMAATANSDTHTTGKWPGNPRTMVGGHHQGVEGLLAAVRRGDMVLTTGPILRVSLSDEGQGTGLMGELFTPVGHNVTLRVEVETPTWFVADRVEVVANAFFEDPTVGGEAPRAVPLVTLEPMTVNRPNGGQALVASTDVHLDLDQAPFGGHDSWIVVRVGGPSSVVFPAMNGKGTVDVDAAAPESFLSERSGVHPFAMTNPIYVDVDGDGVWRGPLVD